MTTLYSHSADERWVGDYTRNHSKSDSNLMEGMAATLKVILQVL